MACVVLPPTANANVTVGPSLNCKDLPELQAFVPCKAKFKIRGSKSRMKGVGLGSVPELADEESIEDSMPQELPLWRCNACTFLNHGLLLRCEMCDGEKSSGGKPNSADIMDGTTNALTIGAVPSHDWPALPETQVRGHDVAESWVECDASSVASSWLDIGGANELSDEDNEGDGVLVSDSVVVAPTLKAVPPPLWSAIVGSKAAAAATVPAAAVAVSPPLSQKSTVRTRAKPIDDEDEEQGDLDVDLDELDARRMLGTRRRRTRRR